ncbi:MAG: hypothetical protein AAF471_08960, partial [Myxococcota bacterium]
RRNYYAATRRDPFALDEDKDVEFFDPYTQLSPRDAVKESSPSVDGTKQHTSSSKEGSLRQASDNDAIISS